MGFLKYPRSSWASKLDAHPLSFFCWAFIKYIYSSSASVAWQSLLLTLTSIGGHLHSPLISLVDVRLSPFFSPHNPLIIFYSTHSAMSMARTHILRKSWKSLKRLSMKQLLGLSSGLCMIWILCVVNMEHSQTIWFCRDNFLWPCYFEKT